MLNIPKLKLLSTSSPLRLTSLGLVTACLGLFLSLFLVGWLLALSLTPSLDRVVHTALGSDRILLSSNGQLLQTLRTDFKKRRLAWFKLNNFSSPMKDAVIQAEDQRFYSHFGIDPIGLGRALWADLRGHPVQGASTLTMQLSDLIQDDVLLKNKSIRKGSLTHKLAQLFRAVLLELRWSKADILEAYLNLIHLRGEFQGVPAFSYAYFGKHPLALDNAEAQVIAAMISSPNQTAMSLKKKACALSTRTAKAGETCTATAMVVDRIFKTAPVMPESPGFALHLARRLFNEHPNEPVLSSTIDINLQQKVIEIMDKNLFRLKDANVHDSSAIVIDNKTGQVLAYVGAVTSSESPHVDGVMAYRQAGSTLKPFLYGKALETKTLTAASILIDDPTAISWQGDVYRPANYDRHFSGPVSAREALASSLNVPAVKTVMILGLREAYHVLQSLHLTHLKEPDFYGVSLALGAVDVRLDELANAYRMLANGGLWSPLRYTSLDPSSAEKERIYAPQSSFIISSILSDPDARSIGFGWENPLETPFWTAVKTGTSKDYHDNWCMGFSDHYTVGVWAGNFNAQAMIKVSGVSGVGPSWYEIMTYLKDHDRSSTHPFAPTPPPGIVAKKIRHQWASQSHTEYFIAGTEPAGEVIEPSVDKRIQFVFPAEGSVLVKDPHMDQSHVALFVRFKGSVPEQSEITWDGKSLGRAVSPFKIEEPKLGEHVLAITTPGHKDLSEVHFQVIGAD